MKTPKVYQMNECDWWCDYSIEEAKKNYVKFVGVDPETQDWEKEPPEELTEEALNKHKYTDEDTHKKRTFKEELGKRIIENDVPSFFASTEY